MKKIIITLMTASLLFVCCDSIESLLDTTNYQKADTSNFPKTEKDATQIVNAIYAQTAKYYKDPKEQPTWRNLVAGDENLGDGNTETQGIDRLLEDDSSNLEPAWSGRYTTIFRANFAIESISALDDDLFSSVDYKNYLLGQAYFLRGWTYWELTQLFETVPVITATEPVNYPRASVDEVYSQITSDLLTAIDLMSAKYDYTEGTSETTARATKYAAEAALGRVWLFYTGFYKKTEMCGVSKKQVVDYLKDITEHSHFGLVKDPREIWNYTNDYSSGFAYGADFETYSSKNNLHWVGNACKESIWITHFSYVNGDGYNRMSDYTSLKGGSGVKNPDKETYPYAKGYYARAVNTNMVKDWITDPDYGTQDIRLWGSLFATGKIDQKLDWMKGQYVELPDFEMETSVVDEQYEDSHFRVKKYIGTVAYDGAAKKTLYKIWFRAGFGSSPNDLKTGDRSDVIHIRYADVLLMLDELEETVTGMNQLRQRAGLKPYDKYTFERLQKERRYELAFEGFRFPDLRRWYPEKAGEIINNNQLGSYVMYKGTDQTWTDVPGLTIKDRYAKTRGFCMIPPEQITLSEGVLTQTPGWTEADGDFEWAKTRLPYTK